MKGPPGPPTPPRARSADDSVETTTPDLDPRKTPRAPPPNIHALRLLDDEPTVARAPDAPGGDLFSGLHDAPPPRPLPDPDATLDPDASPDPMTLPVGAFAAPIFAPAPPRNAPSVAIAAPPFTAPPPPPPPVAPPPPPVAPPPPPAAPLAPLAFATPDDEGPDASVFAQVTLLPCTLRSLLNGLRANPDPRGVEVIAVNLLRCVRAMHLGGAVLGERLVPENFFCHADCRVEYAEASTPPPTELADLYRAPELFKARAPTVQSDVFASATIVYELLVGRSLKPMFLPEVMQSGRTDTWFSDPGRAMHEAYKPSLRMALSDRATQRHGDLGLFAEELTRAWRLATNPVARLADAETPEPPWRKAVLPAVILAVFVLVVLVIALFPVERFDQPPVPTVRPELSQ